MWLSSSASLSILYLILFASRCWPLGYVGLDSHLFCSAFLVPFYHPYSSFYASSYSVYSILASSFCCGKSFLCFSLRVLIRIVMTFGRVAGSPERLTTSRFGYRLATVSNPVSEHYRQGCGSLVNCRGRCTTANCSHIEDVNRG